MNKESARSRKQQYEQKPLSFHSFLKFCSTLRPLQIFSRVSFSLLKISLKIHLQYCLNANMLNSFDSKLFQVYSWFFFSVQFKGFELYWGTVFFRKRRRVMVTFLLRLEGYEYVTITPLSYLI